MTEDQDEHEYGLLYPFVVCASNGGPYEDDAFVAGCYFGQIMSECRSIIDGNYKTWTVPSSLVPQLDLLAMHEGLTVNAEPWEEHPESWTYLRLARAAGRPQ